MDYGRGVLIGEMEILTAGRHAQTVVAVRDSQLANVPAAVLAAIVKRNPDVMVHLARVVSLKVQANKAKEMTKAALQELLLAREELREAHEKLAVYEQNAQGAFSAAAAKDAERR